MLVNRTVNLPYGSHTYFPTQSFHLNGFIIDFGNEVDSQLTGQVKMSGMRIKYAVLTDMSIIHIAVQPNYILKKSSAGVGLGTGLIEQIREIAMQIACLWRVILFYRQEVMVRL